MIDTIKHMKTFTILMSAITIVFFGWIAYMGAVCVAVAVGGIMICILLAMYWTDGFFPYGPG